MTVGNTIIIVHALCMSQLRIWPCKLNGSILFPVLQNGRLLFGFHPVFIPNIILTSLSVCHHQPLIGRPTDLSVVASLFYPPGPVKPQRKSKWFFAVFPGFLPKPKPGVSPHSTHLIITTTNRSGTAVCS